MKILFICGSLEPGRDGVGDYTRRLAGELIRQGNEARIIAYNDKYSTQTEDIEQMADGTEIWVLRIPSLYRSKQKVASAKQFIDAFNPEWLSLQYVPFAFQNKGLPIGLASQLKELGKGRKWHIMFHELWVGMNKSASLKERILGILQRIILKIITINIKPNIIFTSIDSYEEKLKGINIYPNEIVPIFGNIEINEPSSEESVEDLLNELHLSKLLKTEKRLLLGFFGSIYPCEGLIELVQKVAKGSEQMKRKLGILFIGRCHANDVIKQIQYISNIEYFQIGEQKSQMINKLLNLVDLGVMTTPADGLNKSGSAIAWVERAIPIIIPWQDESCNNFILEQNGVYKIKEVSDVLKAFSSKGEKKAEERLASVSKIYSNSFRK